MPYALYNADYLDGLASRQENSIEAIVTDPPYGLKEFSTNERARLQNGGTGGIWRVFGDHPMRSRCLTINLPSDCRNLAISINAPTGTRYLPEQR